MSVQTEIDERGIAWISLDRPEASNALNGPMYDAMANSIAQFHADPAVRILILRGNGKHFTAGADVKEAQRTATGKAASPETATMGMVTAALGKFPKPVIALVNGACIGAGVALICACDVVIAADDAIFAIPEVRLGFSPSGLIPGLNAAMGPRNVRRYAVTGERFSAAAACDTGLVHEVCAAGTLESAAAPIIDALLLGGPQAIADTKALILELGADEISPERVREMAVASDVARNSDDAIEGRAALLEKRKPRWYPGQ